MKKKISMFLILISLLIMNVMPVFAGSDEYYYEDGFSMGAVIIIALIVSVIVCIVLYNSMKSVHTATSAKLYEKENSFVVSDKKDVFSHTTREVIHHEPSNK